MLIFNKKINFYIHFFCLITVFYGFFINNGHAITSKQIMRNLGVPPRSVTESRRKKFVLDRNDNEILNGFHIHADFECNTHQLTDFNPKELSAASYITKEILQNNPLTFSLVIEIIKAHLEIVLKSYYINGINFNLEKHSIRFHNDDELSFYPEDVAIDPTEQAKIYYPDTLRSAAYVYYVMMPFLKSFMTKNEYTDLEKRMSIISFENVLKKQEKRIIWSYKSYQKHIQNVYSILDKMEARHLEKNNISRNNPEFQKKIIDTLLTNHWATFLALRSCDLITPPIDPAYDTNFYYEPPVSRDNYLTGLGIFERIKKLTRIYLFHNQNINPDNRLYALQQYFDFFDGIYKTMNPPIHDTIPYVKIEKLYSNAICSVGVSDTEECQ